jgi:hypothetical protein
LASNAKKKTTFAKLNRENAVRERRQRKQAKREARRRAASTPAPESTGADAPAPGQPVDANPPATPPGS